MKTTVKWCDGMSFEAETQSGHKIKMDGAEKYGGKNKGARPMELLLSSLGGCSCFDVILILKKSKQNITDCKVKISATRANTTPAVFTKIHLDFFINGDALKEKRVQKAVSLSVEKYCSVVKMLQNSVTIDYRVNINYAK
jgi:putative redox protein